MPEPGCVFLNWFSDMTNQHPLMRQSPEQDLSCVKNRKVLQACKPNNDRQYIFFMKGRATLDTGGFSLLLTGFS